MSTSWITENVAVIKAFYSQLLQKKKWGNFWSINRISGWMKIIKDFVFTILDSTGCDYKITWLTTPHHQWTFRNSNISINNYHSKLIWEQSSWYQEQEIVWSMQLKWFLFELILINQTIIIIKQITYKHLQNTKPIISIYGEMELKIFVNATDQIK